MNRSAQACYDAGTPVVPASHQPALVLELLRAQEVPLHGVLQGTGLGAGASLPADLLVSPSQYLRLLGNAARAMDSPEAAFVLGRHLLPGHYGAASHALLQADSLRHAIELLARHPARLSPLLVPHWVVEPDLTVLYFMPACGLGSQRGFVVEMQMAAVAALCRWRAGEPLPWTFCFNRTGSRHAEQLEVHLGTSLRFNCQVDAMLIHPDWLDRPWPRAAEASAAASRAADTAAAQEAEHASLLGALYALLLRQVRDAPTLEDCARHFGMSPSTLKRRLAHEGTHFQAELDQVRSHVALHLFRFRGCDNDAVARHLGFHDAANFRRSFKRWTGLTPSLIRSSLLPVAAG